MTDSFEMSKLIERWLGEPPKPTLYETLGIPVGASIDHVKDSYRLLTRKSHITDAAYRVLTDPTQRREYDGKLFGQSDTARSPTEQEEDYFVVQDDAGWHVITDKDVGWELQSFLPDGKISLKAPKPNFGPFSKSEAEEFAERKRHEPAPTCASAEKLETNRSWTEWGAQREMPQKPPLPTQTELHFIAGIERMLCLGVPLNTMDIVLNYTPEQLLEVSGISVETQMDLDFFIPYVQWLNDCSNWYKSLPEDLAATIAEGLRKYAQGRYRFLVSGGSSGS
jgi:hypothetical protein